MNQFPRFKDALDVLVRHHVDFIIVGGVAAVLNGAPISTFDLDIVHARGEANVDRLLAALDEIDAKYRDFTGRTLRPERPGLLGPGHHQLLTTHGPLNARGLDHAQLSAEASPHAINGGTILVLGLAAVIRTKEAANRDKDRAVLAILKRTLEEQTR
jgi:hypothetical protein